MEQIKKINSLVFLIPLFLSFQTYSQTSIEGEFTVNSIDSIALQYYYIIKVSSEDSIKLNILSDKVTLKGCKKSRKIQVGKKYNFVLEPKYEIVDRRHGKDSVYLSPATMRSVSINNETFISSDYSIHPYVTNDLNGLFFVSRKCKKDVDK